MRYPTGPNYRKYVKGYGFLSLSKKIGNKYGKKLMDTATKTGMNAAKTASTSSKNRRSYGRFDRK